MTKEDLIKNVWQELDITNKEARIIVESVFETIKNVLAKGEQLEIRGFGKFSIREKNKRIGRNPRTGEEAEISERKVVTFRPSRIFKNALH